MVLTVLVIIVDTIILWFGALVLYTFVGLSAMMFDAPGAIESTTLWIVFWSIVAGAITMWCLSVFLAIRFLRKKRWLLSVLCSAIPLTLLILPLILGILSSFL